MALGEIKVDDDATDLLLALPDAATTKWTAGRPDIKARKITDVGGTLVAEKASQNSCP